MGMEFLINNWGTILVGTVLAVVVCLIVFKLYRDRKKGRTSCGCGCSNCPSSGVCHPKKGDRRS